MEVRDLIYLLQKVEPHLIVCFEAYYHNDDACYKIAKEMESHFDCMNHDDDRLYLTLPDILIENIKSGPPQKNEPPIILEPHLHGEKTSINNNE